ncbi:MAG: hypothetical protein NTY09_12840 [bacterium]|nr:hypothetical protein [bacterium]
MRINIKTIIAICFLLLFVMGCGGGTTTPGTTGNLTGNVFAPNGTDPVSGALVYILDKGSTAVGDPPTEPYDAYDYSEANGSFQLDNVPTGSQTLKIIKGAFTKTATINVLEGTNALPAAVTTLPSSGAGVEKMAVVTGNYDSIQNVLAKLGLGDVDGAGSLIIGTESFTLVDGDGSLDDATYANFLDFMGDPANYQDYRTIFINCGNNYEDEFFGDTVKVDNLKAWVAAGGRLYATDWSYDFVEQLWPEYIDFFGTDPGLLTTPETIDAAQEGDSFDSTKATVLDADLLAWLKGIGVTNTDDTITIEGWLSSWAAVDGYSSDVKSWMKALVDVAGSNSSRDITLTFHPSNGTVFYSSYHTEGSLSPGLTPQDRVLQYLIFEVL